jgi:AcrR family transcriptional regulator
MSDKRNQIMDAATRLFGRYGYHAVGIDWVTAESRVTKATMYRYFPSKTDLIAQVLQQRQRDCAASLEKALASADTPLAGLEQVFRWHGDWFNAQNFTGCMFAHAAAEFPSKGSTVHDIAVAQKTGLTKRIEQLAAQLVGAENAAALAPVLVMLLDGATLSAQVADRKASADEAWSAARDLIAAYRARAVQDSWEADVIVDIRKS